MMQSQSLLFTLLLTTYLSFSSSLASAQHATAFDIEDGERAFQNYCANCHGPDGNVIEGIDLGRGLFRRSFSDEELVAVILNGIVDTPMPATPSMSEEQAARIVAYLRDRANIEPGVTLNGNLNRGRELFENKGNCLQCHRVEARGSRLGPDLSHIGLLRPASELEASLLDPAAEVQANNRFYSVVTAEGENVSGRLLNHDTFTVLLLDSNENLRAFSKADLQQFGFSEPQMPSLADDFNSQEIADLVAYLTSLR